MIQPECAESFKEILNAFDAAFRTVLVGHVNADGDVIGSMSALSSRLGMRGMQVTSFLFEPVPERYRFLSFDQSVEIFDADKVSHRRSILDADLIVILDLSVISRLPGWSSLLDEFKGKVICIDHHPVPESFLGHINLINPQACSTGQILFELFRLEEAPLTRGQALALFTAITTDTGWFQYSNTTPETLSMASELLRTGIDPSEVFGYIYQANDFSTVRFTGKLAHETRSALGDRLLWVSISQEALESCGLASFETESILDILRSVKPSQCVALFRETEEGTVRVNLRSKGRLYIHKLAERFGGGGHRKAAGITFTDLSLKEVEKKVINALIEYIGNGGTWIHDRVAE
ncbi:MAG: bifunctional oligoribonuclease/PAP phosphatase NrnA [Planctomycetota bacterium]